MAAPRQLRQLRGTPTKTVTLDSHSVDCHHSVDLATTPPPATLDPGAAYRRYLGRSSSALPSPSPGAHLQCMRLQTDRHLALMASQQRQAFLPPGNGRALQLAPARGLARDRQFGSGSQSELDPRVRLGLAHGVRPAGRAWIRLIRTMRIRTNWSNAANAAV
jgi:hypothetical protein